MIEGTKVRIRPKKLSDAENDYKWQTDAELSALDAMPSFRFSFAEFLREYSALLGYPDSDRVAFAVETPDGRHIGNCVYYNINDDKAETEIGIMIGEKDYWDKGYGTDTIKTLIDYIFQNFEFNRIHLKTLDTNARARKCFQKCGLIPCGYLEHNGYKFLLMEITRSRWQELQKT
ncbi:MAG: GNAT family N-acetyltransferase [Dehalococcoidales bacterium]|nr:GNAT family N-acetyltransferase [Dehalococcoidales bacterium]